MSMDIIRDRFTYDDEEFIWEYLHETKMVVDLISQTKGLEEMVAELVAVRARGGRLFLIGVGGSAANCSHAAADFRTLCGIEAYAFDNMANLTALTNDEGWEGIFARWLYMSNITKNDLLYVMSVGGGSPNLSKNLCMGINYAGVKGAPIIGVAGRDGGYLAQYADACVVVPTVNGARITPHTESMQAVIWHLLVSHPLLKVNKTAWEGK